MAESSNRLAEFSRDYKQRARDLQRTGPVPGMLPSVSEVDEMMRHQQRIQDVLGRLREMVVGQEAALVNQHAQERPFKPTEEFEIEDPGLNPDEAKSNGTASSEKKRRGVRLDPLPPRRELKQADPTTESRSSRQMPQLQQGRDARMAPWPGRGPHPL